MFNQLISSDRYKRRDPRGGIGSDLHSIVSASESCGLDNIKVTYEGRRQGPKNIADQTAPGNYPHISHLH